MQNNISKHSNYQTSGEIKYPIQINPSTAYQFCSSSTLCNKPGEPIEHSTAHNLNITSNQLGNGIGTESFSSKSHPKSLQDKIELIYEQKAPYIVSQNAPPSAIPLNDIINNNSDYIFQNKQLAGGPSARSGIPAVIAPPSHSEEYWKTNDFLVRSGINSESTVDLTRSGYLVRNDETYPVNASTGIPTSPSTLKESYINDPKTYINTTHDLYNNNHESSLIKNGTMLDNDTSISQNTTKEDFKQSSAVNSSTEYKFTTNLNPDERKTIVAPPDQCSTKNYIENIPCEKKIVTVGPIEDEMINMPYGYNPDQLEISNIPSNLPSSMIQRNPIFNSYNKDIFTTTIQPGVYSRTEIIEPLNSNIGISFPQQFEPVVCEKSSNGGVTFVQKDHRIQPVNQEVNITPPGPNESNVYDPRFTGYGTNYRAYIDKMTGQPRFYYDDVMVHRQNNFITRNKLDFTDFGVKNNDINQQYTNSEIRNLAQNHFTDNTIDFRTQLQTRLLRKANVNSWQQKVAPININSS